MKSQISGNNQLTKYIIAPEDKIEKKLLAFILKASGIESVESLFNSKKYPNPLLRQKISYKDKNDFFSLYEKVEQLSLTQNGTYYGSINHHQYINFSQNTIMYAKKVNEYLDKGWIYEIGKNVYMGEIKKGMAHGKGLAFYYEEYSSGERMLTFEGKWEEGSIVSGKNEVFEKKEQTDQNENYELAAEYQGHFKEFQFHGQGKLIQHERLADEPLIKEGKFIHGDYRKEDKVRISALKSSHK